MVVFHLAGDGSCEPSLELGLVLSVWKGIKSPKLVATECHVNACTAFRAVSLDILDEDSCKVTNTLLYVFFCKFCIHLIFCKLKRLEFVLIILGPS